MKICFEKFNKTMIMEKINSETIKLKKIKLPTIDYLSGKKDNDNWRNSFFEIESNENKIDIFIIGF